MQTLEFGQVNFRIVMYGMWCVSKSGLMIMVLTQSKCISLFLIIIFIWIAEDGFMVVVYFMLVCDSEALFALTFIHELLLFKFFIV